MHLSFLSIVEAYLKKVPTRAINHPVSQLPINGTRTTPLAKDRPEKRHVRAVPLLDGHGLGQVAREIDVQALSNGKPVSH